MVYAGGHGTSSAATRSATHWRPRASPSCAPRIRARTRLRRGPGRGGRRAYVRHRLRAESPARLAVGCGAAMARRRRLRSVTGWSRRSRGPVLLAAPAQRAAVPGPRSAGRGHPRGRPGPGAEPLRLVQLQPARGRHTCRLRVRTWSMFSPAGQADRPGLLSSGRTRGLRPALRVASPATTRSASSPACSRASPSWRWTPRARATPTPACSWPGSPTGWPRPRPPGVRTRRPLTVTCSGPAVSPSLAELDQFPTARRGLQPCRW